MKLALCYDNETGNVCHEFEKTKVLKIYEAENGEILSSELIGTMAESAEDIVGLIGMMEADGVLCGDITDQSRELLNEEGILLYSGLYDNADEAVRDFISGYLIFGPDD